MFAIGDEQWPGISKLVEEAGEVTQVCGKLMGTRGATNHWDGSDLKSRLESELGDLLAAIEFTIKKNNLDMDIISVQRDIKFKLFEEWHKNNR